MVKKNLVDEDKENDKEERKGLHEY